jgi:hypothetical protein
MSTNYNSGTRMFYVRKSDGLAYCFSPVPLIAESHENVSLTINGETQRMGARNRATFNGTLLPELPALSGVSADATCLELLDRKSDQMRSALDEDYGNLLIVDASGYPVFSQYPRVVSVDFDSSQMVTKRDYQIVFEYDSGFSNDRIVEYSDTWAFTQNEDDTSSATHTVSALGANIVPAATGAFEAAKNFVLGRVNTLDRNKYYFLSSPYVTDSTIDLDNLSEYNHTRSETVDVPGGRYEISESWILSSGAFKDDRTVETAYELNDLGVLVPRLTINGTVVGYGDTTTQRFNNAANGFTSFVSPQINFTSPTGIDSRSRTDNRYAGSVSYNVVFTVAATGLDEILEERSIQRQFTRNDDGTVSQTVTTTARVRQSSASGIEVAIDYCRNNNDPISSAYEPIFSVGTAIANIESVSSTRDEIVKSFSLTRTFRDQESPLWREEYQVNRDVSVENARTTITVQGTVAGLAAETGTKSTIRFNAASGAYFGTIEPLIRSRASVLASAGTCIGTSPTNQSLGYNMMAGTITYSHTYDNRVKSTNANVNDESIEVSYNLPASVIAEFSIPENGDDGPILQDQNTTTGSEKSLRITYTMRPSGTACSSTSISGQYVMELEALAESNILINNTQLQNERGEKPLASRVFKVQDQYTFNRTSYTFSRNVTWKYPNT